MDGWYKDIICMEPVNSSKIMGPTPENLEAVSSIPNRLEVPENQKYLCVRIKGHDGPCSCNLNHLFYGQSESIKKLKESIRLCIYSTPGNDDYVYKNRASRLFPVVLTNDQEKTIRDKKVKKKCAIPKKDMSRPEYLAQAYIDWLTFCVNIRDIQPFINVELRDFEVLTKNKEMLKSYYEKFNRNIFSPEGFTRCVVTGQECNLEDFADATRDNRVSIRDTDIQLGHNKPRSDEWISIRGFNLVPMSRRGNLILGERVYTEEVWREELKRILLNV